MSIDRLKMKDRVEREQRVNERRSRGASAGVVTVGGSLQGRYDRSRSAVEYLTTFSDDGSGVTVPMAYAGMGIGALGSTLIMRGSGVR